MRLAAVVVMALALAGCRPAQPDYVQLTTLYALEQPASGPLTIPPAVRQRGCPHMTASLRPPHSLPAPDAMPAGSFMAAIRRRGVLRAGVDQNTLLFSYLNPDTGRLEGFEIDLLHNLARAIFGDSRNRLALRAITTDEREDAVRSGDVDIVVDAMTINCERLQNVNFSSVYFETGQRVLVPSNSTIRGPQDLAGKRVCATVRSTSMDNIQLQLPRAIPYPVAQRTDCLVRLQQGQVDAISTDESFLHGFQAQDPYTKIVGPRFSSERYGMAISKEHPDFVRFVNGVLARMRADGRWRAIYRRWLGRFGPTPAAPAPEYRG